MKKPLCNGYTLIWIEVPDEEEQPRPRQRGTKAPATRMLNRLRGRLASLRPGLRIGGALSGALATIALLLTAR